MSFTYIMVFVLFVLAIVVGVLVIATSNPVYAVLSLVGLFIISSFFLLVLGIQFLAFVYILVYIGAVLILFLWVVMTMPIKKNHLLHFRLSFFSLAFFLFLVLSFYIFLPSDFVKVCRLTPDSPLFSAYVHLVRETIDFRVYLIPLPGSEAFTALNKFLPGFIINKYFLTELTQPGFLKDIFTIYNTQHVIYPAPIADGSVFLEKLKFYYFLDHPKTFIETIFFYGYVSRVNDSCTFYVLLRSMLDVSMLNNLLFIPQHGSLTVFSKILPSFIDISNFVFLAYIPSDPHFLIEPSKCFLSAFSTNWFSIFLQPNKRGLWGLSSVLYTTYGVVLLVVSVILLVSLVGAIFLIKSKNLNVTEEEGSLQTGKDSGLRSKSNL